jgi:hypothetical protein
LDEVKEAADKDKIKLPDLILAIEEPELYLHPSRSRFLSSVLEKLAAKPTDAKEARTQVIFATHSPYFIHINQFDRLRLAKKIPTPGKDVLQCEICAFGKEQASARLTEIADKKPDTFTADSFVAHTVPVMTTTVNEGFFSDVAVVVEGLCEVGVLWALQDILKKNWDRLGIVVVPAEGKSKIDRPVVIFRGLRIPTYFVFDADSKLAGKKNKNETSAIALNKLYCRLAGIPIQDFLKTQVNPTWAVFEHDIETEIQTAVGTEYFMNQREIIAQDLGYAEPSKVLKNPEAAGRLIRAAYKDGKPIAVLEKIVDAITVLKG